MGTGIPIDVIAYRLLMEGMVKQFADSYALFLYWGRICRYY